MKKLLVSAVIAVIGFTGLINAAQSPLSMATMNKPDGHYVPTYLRGAYENVATATANLKKAGFTIVGQYNVLNDGTTILFTDSALKREAAKKDRGFIALMRLYVDKRNNQISITNPIYFGKAFMQDDYSQSVFYKELTKITSVFTGLDSSVDQLKFDDLSEYHFMWGMPYYTDFATLDKGSNEALLAKLKSYKNGKNFLFDLKLADGSYIVGYKLNKKISAFPKTIGLKNALVLPYLILISDNKAKILNPKYYLAISYPSLSMGQFMQISSIPGDIESDLKKPFDD